MEGAWHDRSAIFMAADYWLHRRLGLLAQTMDRDDSREVRK